MSYPYSPQQFDLLRIDLGSRHSIAVNEDDLKITVKVEEDAGRVRRPLIRGTVVGCIETGLIA
jgi:hypothetical protein